MLSLPAALGVGKFSKLADSDLRSAEKISGKGNAVVGESRETTCAVDGGQSAGGQGATGDKSQVYLKCCNAIYKTAAGLSVFVGRVLEGTKLHAAQATRRKRDCECSKAAP